MLTLSLSTTVIPIRSRPSHLWNSAFQFCHEWVSLGCCKQLQERTVISDTGQTISTFLQVGPAPAYGVCPVALSGIAEGITGARERTQECPYEGNSLGT